MKTRVAAFAFLLAGSPLSAQSTFTLDRFLDLERMADPAISPNGQSIVFTRIRANRIADQWEVMLWQMDDEGKNPRQVAPGHHAAWSPNGKQLAYLAEIDGVTQLRIRDLDGGGRDRVMTTGTAVRAFRWSPNGDRVALTRLVPFAPPIAIGSPIPAEGGNWAANPTITTRLRSEEGFVQLFVVDSAGGAARQVTGGGFDVGARDTGVEAAIPFDWLGDGAMVVFDGALDAEGERRYQDSHLFVVQVATGELHRLTATDGFWHTPVVSPDGKQIAFTGFLLSSQGYAVQQLFVIRPDGGGLRALTAQHDRDVVTPRWDSDNQTIWFASEDRGVINSWSVSSRDGKLKPGSNGVQRMALAAISPKGGFGLSIRSTPDSPPELVRFPLKKPWEVQPLTQLNSPWARTMQLGETEEFEYRSGSALIQGWLVKPPGFTLGNRFPMHVELHGGPHAMHALGFSPIAQQMAAAGYLVFIPNPRGSTGYGSEFGNALGERFPGVDLEDVLNGVDEVISRGYVDTTQVFVGGCGAGGMLAQWVVGRSPRFTAAAVRCPGNDWVAGSPAVFGAEEVAFFSRPWRQDRIGWTDRSPLQVVGGVRSPSLIIAGDCVRPAPHDEGGDWFTALQVRGVPSALVRLADECGAATKHPSNWMRTRQLIVDWYRMAAARAKTP